jgi:hypothetical protein
MSVRAIASVVVAVIVLAGCSGTPGSTAPVATAQLTPSALATQLSTPEPSIGRPVPASGELAPGRYVIPAGPRTPATVSYAIAASGWVAQNAGQTVSKHVDDSQREVSFSISIVDQLFAHPCGEDDRLPVGPTVDDLIAGLLSLPELVVAPAAAASIGGRPGKVFELSVPDGFDDSTCDPPIGLQVWLDRPGDKYLVLGSDITTRVHAVDVAGGRFILTVNYRNSAYPADLAEFEAIVESIQFHE